MFACQLLVVSLIASQLMPSLLPMISLQVLLLLGAMVMLLAQITKNKLLLMLSLVLLAFSYGQFFGHQQIASLWRINDPRDVHLHFTVDSLVQEKGRYQKFEAVVASDSQVLAGQRILLNAYSPISVEPCQRYHAAVRLKPIHGLQNAAGFDYYRYLFVKGVKAKGYVKTVISQKPADTYCSHRFRQTIKTELTHLFPEVSPWLLALAIGDQSGLVDSQWQLLKETATGHLFVVSGLHIGLIAFAVFYAVLLLKRIGLAVLYKGDWRPLAYVLAFVAAFIYALLAGFSLPTQRALIMLLVFFFGQFLGVRISVWLRYVWALLLLLLIQPNAFLNAGFVLSFVALFFVLSLAEQWPKADGLLKRIGLLMLWQLLLSCLLLPLSYYYFSYWPLLSPLYNLLAIPWVTFLVLPWLLLGLLLWWLLDSLLLLSFAATTLQFFIDTLAQVHNHLNVTVDFALTFWPLLMLSVIFSIIVIKQYRRFWPLAACLILLLSVRILAPKAPQALASLTVIDVGQGLSVLLQSQGQTLLVDLGSRWQTGSMVKMAVLPQLRAKKIHAIDHLVISHRDNDHLGDISYLLSKIDVHHIYSHSQLKQAPPEKQHLCRQGQRFSVGAVTVAVISPKVDERGSENDRSCVLLLSVLGQYILLPGDISAVKEQSLLAYLPWQMQVLVLAHHGSRYSSSPELLTRFKGGLAISSAGFLNPFKHPHPDVQKRLLQQKITLLNTAEHGMVQWQLNPDGKAHWWYLANTRQYGYW